MMERVQGTFEVDNLEMDLLDFHDKEIVAMKKQGYNPNLENDRRQFATKNNLLDELKLIPHQWNEYKGEIIDLTGYAQFVETGLSSDTNKSRYTY